VPDRFDGVVIDVQVKDFITRWWREVLAALRPLVVEPSLEVREHPDRVRDQYARCQQHPAEEDADE